MWQLVPGYVPPLCGLPLFVLRLATRVDWTAEQPCFESLARELAVFYRVAQLGDYDAADAAADAAADRAGADGDDTDGAARSGDGGGGGAVEDSRSEAWTVQHVLLPAIRRDYEAPTAHSANGVVVQVACTEMLYKIFERC